MKKKIKKILKCHNCENNIEPGDRVYLFSHGRDNFIFCSDECLALYVGDEESVPYKEDGDYKDFLNEWGVEK